MINDYSNLSERDIAKLFNSSIKTYPLFAKSMEEKTDKRYHSNLIEHWKGLEEKRIELCNLQDVSKGVLVYFHSFYTRIFRVYYYMHQYYRSNSSSSLTRMNIERCRFENDFIKSIKNLIDAINNCVLSGKYEKAIRIKNYEISLFRSIEVHISNAHIDLNKSPFYAVFNYGRRELGRSINIQEVDISSRIISSVDKEMIYPDSINGELEKTIGNKNLVDDNSSRPVDLASETLTLKTKKSVESYLSVIKDYAFINDKDYDTYSNLLVQFFQGDKVETKGISIRLKRNSKTKVMRQHNLMHQELGLTENLRSDIGYTEIIKVLQVCSNLTHLQIYDAMTK
tara:strand:- start:5328 stop:6347 length:1020 start_codon:yes stop_codon:yes gene_type:complete